MSTLSEVHQRILDCSKCELRQNARAPVPGRGPEDAEVVIVGQAPGRIEDREGKPFVGPCGKLLDKWIEEWEIEPYITNVCRCFPPGDRMPTKSEVNACFPHLSAELGVIHPRLIIATGKLAQDAFDGMPGVVYIYHPGYYLRGNPWEKDVLRVKKELKRLM